MDDESINHLRAVLSTGTAKEQSTALMDLVAQNVESAVPMIAAMLTSPEAVVRANAAHALGRLGAGQAEFVGAALLPLLHDSDELVRSDVIEALGNLSYAPAVGPLTHLLRTDSNALVRAEAAETLGDLGDAHGLDALLHAVEHDSDDVVRGYCANAVGLIGGAEHLPMLAECSLRDPSLRVKIELLGARYRLGDTAALPELLGTLTSADADLATSLLNLLDDLTTRHIPASLAVDAEQLAAALASLAQRLGSMHAHVEQVIERLHSQ